MDNIKGEIIKDLALEVIAVINENNRKEKNRKRLHNTKLLLQNYNALEAHAYKVDDKNKFEKLSIDEDDEIFIESITRTRMRTIKMLSYVDSALKIVKSNYKKNNEKYKFLVFEKMYFDKKTIEEITIECNCSKNTARRWNNLIIEELSLLLWGIDSLEF